MPGGLTHALHLWSLLTCARGAELYTLHQGEWHYVCSKTGPYDDACYASGQFFGEARANPYDEECDGELQQAEYRLDASPEEWAVAVVQERDEGLPDPQYTVYFNRCRDFGTVTCDGASKTNYDVSVSSLDDDSDGPSLERVALRADHSYTESRSMYFTLYQTTCFDDMEFQVKIDMAWRCCPKGRLGSEATYCPSGGGLYHFPDYYTCNSYNDEDRRCCTCDIGPQECPWIAPPIPNRPPSPPCPPIPPEPPIPPLPPFPPPKPPPPPPLLGAHRAMYLNHNCKSQGDEWMDQLTYKVFFDVSFQQCDYFAYRDNECVKDFTDHWPDLAYSEATRECRCIRFGHTCEPEAHAGWSLYIYMKFVPSPPLSSPPPLLPKLPPSLPPLPALPAPSPPPPRPPPPSPPPLPSPPFVDGETKSEETNNATADTLAAQEVGTEDSSSDDGGGGDNDLGLMIGAPLGALAAIFLIGAAAYAAWNHHKEKRAAESVPTEGLRQKHNTPWPTSFEVEPDPLLQYAMQAQSVELETSKAQTGAFVGSLNTGNINRQASPRSMQRAAMDFSAYDEGMMGIAMSSSTASAQASTSHMTANPSHSAANVPQIGSQGARGDMQMPLQGGGGRIKLPPMQQDPRIKFPTAPPAGGSRPAAFRKDKPLPPK